MITKYLSAAELSKSDVEEPAMTFRDKNMIMSLTE